jgi:hypothetical protein
MPHLVAESSRVFRKLELIKVPSLTDSNTKWEHIDREGSAGAEICDKSCQVLATGSLISPGIRSIPYSPKLRLETDMRDNRTEGYA